MYKKCIGKVVALSMSIFLTMHVNLVTAQTELMASFYGVAVKCQVYINDQLIGFKKNDSWTVSILNQQHPLSKKSLPDMIKKDMFFILKEGVNTIKVKFENTHEWNNYGFRFILYAPEYQYPIFVLFDDVENNPRNKGIIEKTFAVQKQLPVDLKTTLAYKNLGYIHFNSNSTVSVTLNGEVQGFFGNDKGTIPLKTLQKGKNTLTLKYEATEDDTIEYMIVTPSFCKVVTEKLEKDKQHKKEYDFEVK